MIESLTQEQIARIDQANMLDRVLGMPGHFIDAIRRAKSVPLDLKINRIKNIVVAGMGGSAIGGEIVKCLTYNQLPVPLSVCRSYYLPKFVDPGTLVLISSYSGNTEETLAAFEQALQRKAQIVCITSGGKVARLAEANNLPQFTLPSGFPPRSALVHLIVPLLYILNAVHFIPDPQTGLNETVALLEELGQRYHPKNTNARNLARELAFVLSAKVPIIYATEIYEAIAWRWKEQFCENSKVLAWHNVFPELNHNELVGWGLRREWDQRFQVIYLRDPHASTTEIHPRVQARMDLTRGLIEQTSVPVIEVTSEGKSLLARFFSLIFLGDLVSVYLAVLNDVDPTPVEKINYLKSQMAKVPAA
ncbi:MAG: bifunctional phosphoglucose/phosphomannose isomerase [candidate division KSB1 bacterium]|nr:bifunctional phosphoglucose/phosphomannose isomerase [candidate division KSB1 bacterium]MDZ7303449.1 bifunctional phosphoglucose/phosphomannose isomerase [candidate division KSB1 bacterium]MDZ7312531.1 bifunctional phosphoglucose/phosphomannose isomerase [candidate division KSB1 bacterium]